MIRDIKEHKRLQRGELPNQTGSIQRHVTGKNEAIKSRPSCGLKDSCTVVRLSLERVTTP